MLWAPVAWVDTSLSPATFLCPSFVSLFASRSSPLLLLLLLVDARVSGYTKQPVASINKQQREREREKQQSTGGRSGSKSSSFTAVKSIWELLYSLLFFLCFFFSFFLSYPSFLIKCIEIICTCNLILPCTLPYHHFSYFQWTPRQQ